ncbi:helicase-related protein [Streptomyces sp. PmtA]|uniref:helicase-related protein n=1 Tax=Streptomyces sp. PmtA TaxID=3074275 RepID=UPI0030156B44
MGEEHARQIARIAEESGISCGTLHHTMSAAAVARTRRRFESDSGDLQGIVQLRMLGQGYDFPPITVVVPMRPYGSFSEFYQFVGRGMRILSHRALTGRVAPEQQYMDVVCHAELGHEEHLEAICAENDMDPSLVQEMPVAAVPGMGEDSDDRPDGDGSDAAGRAGSLDAFVLYEQGQVEQRVVHGADRVEARRSERELALMAQRYAEYAKRTEKPVPFEQFVEVMRRMTRVAP